MPFTNRETLLGRRRLLQSGLMTAAGLAAVRSVRPARADASEATYFTWGGYDTDGFQGSYMEKHGTAPTYAVYADAEEALTKLRAGFTPDVSFPCSTDVPRWYEAGVVQPVDTTRLAHWGDIFESLKATPGFVMDGQQICVPMNYGSSTLVYRSDLLDLGGEELSWEIMFDERLKGKLIVLDSAADTWWILAIAAGIDFATITEDDVAKVNDMLRRLRDQAMLFTADVTAMEQALGSGDAIAAVTWGETGLTLRKEGLPVVKGEPKEGALVWSCGHVIIKDAPHLDLAYDMLDALTSPETGEFMITEFGYGHANAKAYANVTDEILALSGLTRDPSEFLARGKTYVVQSQELTTQIERDWQQIVSGF